MFPNLRILCWEFIREASPLMHHLAGSSLTCLEINFVFSDVPPFYSFPQSLGDLCPNLRKFCIRTRRPQIDSDEAISYLVGRWTNLQVLYCPYISLDVDALTHLSRTPSLTNLSFTLNVVVTDHITSSDSILIFPGLRDLEISSQSLQSISRLLSHMRLPTLESLTAHIDSCPSNSTLRSYLIAVQKICTCRFTVSLRLIQTRSSSSTSNGLERYHLSLEDMRPCMAFDHLCRIDIDTASVVNLVDDDLLELASAWPHLEHLLISKESGWKTQCGITPNGLLQFLQRLESLHHFCLAIDTWGYITPLALGLTWTVGYTPRNRYSSVNVTDSIIQPESVDALAPFFGGILKEHCNVSPFYWSTSAMAARLDSEILNKLWEGVFVKAHEWVRAHSGLPMISERP